MVFFRDACHQPAHADPVRSHDDRPGQAFLIQKRSTQRICVARAQFEDVAHFNTANGFQRTSTIGAGCPIFCQDNIRHDIGFIIPAEVGIAQMETRLVRSGNQVGRTWNQVIYHNPDLLTVNPDWRGVPRAGTDGFDFGIQCGAQIFNHPLACCSKDVGQLGLIQSHIAPQNRKHQFGWCISRGFCHEKHGLSRPCGWDTQKCSQVSDGGSPGCGYLFKGLELLVERVWFSDGGYLPVGGVIARIAEQ